MRRVWLILLSVALFPLALAAARAQGPLGPEFRVNTYTANSEFAPAVAVDPAGNFVVVWQSGGQYVSDTGIFGQRFASSGVPLGPEFRVNTYTPFDQVRPKVAADPGGNFVVVWTTTDQYGTFGYAHGQRYASDGTSLGGEFRLNNYTNTGATGVASAPDGGFVATYFAVAPDDASGGTFGQRFASSGAPLGPEFRVNSYTTGSQAEAKVAADPAGNFVVVWVSVGQDGSSFGVFGQRYAADGTPLGSEFRVNTYTTGHQGEPAVAVSAGQFVVVWEDTFQETEIGIFGQRFASSGIPLGPEFRVNTAYPMTQQRNPSVAADPDGNFVVTWEKGYLQGAIVGKRFGSDGVPLGAEFRVNTYTTIGADHPAVAADAAGAFVVTWTGHTTLVDVYGQRFRPMVPVELMHFGVE